MSRTFITTILFVAVTLDLGIQASHFLFKPSSVEGKAEPSAAMEGGGTTEVAVNNIILGNGTSLPLKVALEPSAFIGGFPVDLRGSTSMSVRVENMPYFLNPPQPVAVAAGDSELYVVRGNTVVSSTIRRFQLKHAVCELAGLPEIPLNES